MRIKPWHAIVALLVLGAIGWYLVSPAFIVIEADEESPIIKDAMDSMTEEEKAAFVEAVEAASEIEMVMSDAMPGEPRLLAQGEFMERAHGVEGRALLIDADGKKVLRFEDFDTINGPDLHIYLASDLGDGDVIDLGKIKATRGNVNYDIDPSIDTDKYNKVLVWCVPFRVLFSYAELE